LGWVGVPIFFVISGYCISATADATRRKGGQVRDYFKRRVRRIFPPYWIMAGLTCIFVGGLELAIPGLLTDELFGMTRPWDVGAWNWLGNLTLTEAWLGPLSGKGQYVLDTAWTLCYEEQFYAVTGLLLIVSRRRFFAGALVVTVLTMAAILTKLAVPGAFFDGHWFMFAAGIGVYYAVNHASRAGRRWMAVLLAGGVGYAASHPRLPGGAPGHFKVLLVAFTFALVILMIHKWDRRMAEARLLAPLMFCGTLCYSLYLVHWPIAKAVSHGAVLAGITGGLQTMLLVIPLSCACSLAAAWGFHRAVERRFMNAPRGNP
jgi:peptidoglycan/LPS O-acetylase OafA/YrhL